jgi:NADPH:quinone reductase-like Zn-dependent oxidoreductase
VGVVEHGDTLRPGSRVWFNTDAGMRPGDGSLAEAAVVDEAQTVPVPSGLADEQAAALGLSGVAAWMALTWRGRLRRGETVLVLGAGGVVGQVAVQTAAALGAGVVVAASRRSEARERALAHGATATADLGATDVDELTARMSDAVQGAVDLVVDPVCGDAATAALRVLGPGGRLVQLGSSGGPTATFSSASLRSGTQSILGYTNASLTVAQRAEALSRVFDLAAAGRCEVRSSALPLDQVAEGWAHTGTSPDGRVVVVPGR